MSSPATSMVASLLSAIKGWPSMYAVDFIARLSANVTLSPVPRGTVMHLNSVGEWELGVGNKRVMPGFSFQASDEPDVVNDGGDPATDKRPYVGIVPDAQPNIMCIMAVHPCELVSTNYNTGGSYAPNVHLTAAADNATAAGGRLTPATFGTNTIVGVCSRGVVDNGYGFNGVAFWPHYIPGDNS